MGKTIIKSITVFAAVTINIMISNLFFKENPEYFQVVLYATILYEFILD